MLSFNEFYARYHGDMPTLYDGQIAKIYTAYVKLDGENKCYRAIIDEHHANIDVITTKIGRRSVKLITFKPDLADDIEDVLKHVRLEYRTDLDRFEVKRPYEDE